MAAASFSDSPDQNFYSSCVLLLNIISLPTYLACRFIQAPYGRHNRTGWGPTIPSWLSWFLMESPAVWFSLLIYPLGRNATYIKSLSLLSVFLLHYIHRTCIYPFRLRGTPTQARFPISIALMAFSFNLFNAYIQARWISHYGDYEPQGMSFWLRFAIGLVIFGVGMSVNVKADMVLVGMKKKGEGYKIPRGGCFEWVSCANYFGEILEWLGWTIMTWSWAGFGFLLYTCAYLVPRASANHRWYLSKFAEDYPKHRKAVIPFLY